MTLETENKLISDVNDIKQYLLAMVVGQEKLISLFSKYDDSYNEEILKEGYNPN